MMLKYQTMKNIRKNSNNPFARFFNVSEYIALKNSLFNYRFRKYMITKSYQKNKEAITSKNLKILDVGCGISPVSPLPFKTIFIDEDKQAIDLLKKQNYSALKGNVNHLPVANENIDYLFCSEVLEHVPKPNIAIAEFKRVLRNRGKLFITVPTHMHYWSFDDEYVGHLRRFDPTSFIKQLTNSGFKIVEIKPIGSFIERAITKFLVKLAIKQRQTSKNITPLFLKLFKILNNLFFAMAYLGYLFNTPNSSSIILIVAQKND
ncbi:class I SAM-dependent methyltransferase [Candidatus Pacearchaeota archaeon]|nr:class I SAM-dependent methyltransferase [Candidatus Pacearchaeota archaeon]